MNTPNFSRLSLCVFVLMAMSTPLRLLADAPSAADFLPVGKGGQAEVESPAVVKVDQQTNTVSAKTGQDAANASRDLTQSKSKGASGRGACHVDFPSGPGMVATGRSNYSLVKNRTLSRINQRQAVLEAFMLAKKAMAELLGGIDNEGAEEIRKSLSQLYDADSENGLANRNRESVSTVKQSLDLVLRSFVIHEIQDKQNADGSGTIYVTIAISPKTTLQVDRLAGGFVTEGSLSEGINRVIEEVQSGVVAPVGARFIEVPGTNESAFVGFGAAVVGDNEDPEIRKELLETALTEAEMYANDSLCGLLHGDRTVYKGEIPETHRNTTQQYTKILSEDPDTGAPQERTLKLDKAVKSIVSEKVTAEVLSNARRGRVPAGVTKKSWLDDDKEWAYAIAVYSPSATAKAVEIKKMMDESQLLPQQGGSLPSRVRPAPREAGEEQEPPRKVKPLQSGKVGGDL
jgi:hypothetical protein